MHRVLTIVCCGAVLAGCATTYDFHPITDASETVKYDQGTATTYFDSPEVAIQVSPLGLNQSTQIMFGVAVINKSDKPINFGFENLSMTTGDGTPIAIYDRKTLERQARNRAIIAATVVAAAGAASAAIAADSAYSTTNASVSTPRGVYRYSARTYNPGLAYAGTAAAAAATGASLASIESRLRQTMAGLNGRILATTTIDPGESYGGVVVGDRLKGGYPQVVVTKVAVAGVEHSFRFNVSEQH